MPKRRSKNLVGILFCLFLLSVKGTCALACSLWAVTGERSKEAGSIIGQTWDAPREMKGELRLVVPAKGFRYLGLFPLEVKSADFIAAGLNERGLAVFTASADTAAPKSTLAGRRGIVEAILTSFESVDAVISKKNIFLKSSPVFLLLADNSTIALVQIGSHGRIAAEVTGNGLFYHTNHYTHQVLLSENKHYSVNSVLRRNRLQYLLGQYNKSFTVEDFLAITGDNGNESDSSILRTGSQDQKRTLASWVVFLPRGSAPEMYFKLINPGSNELNYEIKLDRSFWTEGTE